MGLRNASMRRTASAGAAGGRTHKVLRGAEDGAATADIARVLGLSEGTVRNAFSEATGKLGARGRVEAAGQAREQGWL